MSPRSTQARRRLRIGTALLLAGLAAATPLAAKKVLVIYDGEEGKSEGFISSSYLFNLLGHFPGLSLQQVAADRYPAGLARESDVTFVYFEHGATEISDALMDDLMTTGAAIVWLNLHVDRFLEACAGKYGFSCDTSATSKEWRVRYRGQTFPKEDPELNLVELQRPANVRVYATVEGPGKRAVPYILAEKNLWYVADSPFSYANEGGRFLILADLLHEILGEPHSPSHRALVRIEDVNAEDDPASLRAAADLLAGMDVPFQVAVTPIYRDPAAQIEVYLHERPEMVAALRYAVSKGGTLVMHGVTHQYRGLTADDFEFWDDIRGRPISDPSPGWLDRTIKTGLDELVACGLYPLAWETPHYAASQDVYRGINRYFDSFYDRVMVADIGDTQQIFPYVVHHQRLGVTVIPENLGFLPAAHPDPVPLLACAERMLMVRDGVASFYFHVFMPLKHLRTIVKGMQEMGWTFVSLRDFKCNVHSESQWITSSGGVGSIVLANQYLHEVTIAKNGRKRAENHSTARLNEVWSKNAKPARGEIYVMEALDLLPEAGQSDFLKRVKAGAASLFQGKDAAPPLRVFRSLVVSAQSPSREDENDQNSFASVLGVFGFNPTKWELGRKQKFSFAGFDIIAVPCGAAKALTSLEINAVLDFTERGGVLITDGRSVLAERLGIRFERSEIPVAEVRELSLPVANIRWPDAGSMAAFACPGALELAQVAGSEKPLVVTRSFGKGRVLFFGTLFDPHTAFGISRFPHFPFYLKNFLAVSFNARRNNLEFYFDPGLHQGTSWEKLVKGWRKGGVRIVYLAAWHFWPDYRFDYSYFIDLCHSQGIAVYAWLEFPFVTPLLWEQHPDWRERSADGSDRPVSWRRMLNLFHPQAREAARLFLSGLLRDHDWDGVNLAELNFESDRGLRNPGRFQPLNDQIRGAFKKRAGFDPLLLFQPASGYHWQKNAWARETFLEFRAQALRELVVFFLDEIERIRREKKREMEVVVTVLDSLLHPEIYEEVGIRALDIVALMNRYDFTLQVEDPARSWAEPPDRYLRYYWAYLPHVRDASRLMFDVNVVDRGDVSGRRLPTPTPIGTELATTLHYASIPCGRAGIYCEATVNPFDMDILPFVLGADVEIMPLQDGFELNSRHPFTLAVNASDFIALLNDGKWPFYGPRSISVPSGTQRLELREAKVLDFLELRTHIAFNGDVYDLSTSGNACSFRYRSPIPVVLGFSRALGSLSLDGAALAADPARSVIILPRGSHRVEISTQSPEVMAVDILGYLSANLFNVLGTLSVMVLMLIYSYSRLRRRVQ